MPNVFAIETDAAYRRLEWERAIAAEVRVARARSPQGRMPWAQLPHLLLARLRSLSAPWFAPLVAPDPSGAGEDRAQTLKGGHAVAT